MPVHERSFFDQSGATGLYDRARPSYPLPLVDTIFKRVGKPSGVNVIELGAGTGIFTRLLIERPEIARIAALEPSEGMRKGFQTAVLDQLPAAVKDKVSLDTGLFTDIPAPDASVDLIAIAQAFHWIGREAEQHEAALKEFARVLKPGGILALIWNLEDRTIPWVAQIRDAYEIYEEDSPQYRQGYWKGIFTSPGYNNFAHPIDGTKPGHESITVQRKIPTTRQGVWERALSKSYVQVLSDDNKTELSKQINATLDKGEGLTWIDETKGVFEYPYATDLILLRRV